jgi:hypothetical protein
MKWDDMLNLALDQGRSREDIAQTIRKMVEVKLITSDEATARINQLDRQIVGRKRKAH